MLQERDVFREIIRLLGLALLVYGLYMALQYGLTVLYFSPYDSISTNRLLLVSPLAYALLGLLFLLSPASTARHNMPTINTPNAASELAVALRSVENPSHNEPAAIVENANIPNKSLDIS